jgi:hypothetical protein
MYSKSEEGDKKCIKNFGEDWFVHFNDLLGPIFERGVKTDSYFFFSV